MESALLVRQDPRHALDLAGFFRDTPYRNMGRIHGFRALALARLGRHALPPGGRLYAELNQALGPQTADLFRAWGYTAVELRRDQFGHDRMVKAVAPDSFPLQTLTP